MIRLILIWLAVVGICVYARRDWFKSLCLVVVMMAFVEHPDMPKTLWGIQGLNPWNIALLGVLAGWRSAREAEGLKWDMPRSVQVLLVCYLLVVLVAFLRMFVDRTGIEDETTPSLISEYLINSFKWVIPGLLFFDGCRSRARLNLAVLSILTIYFLLAIQVIKWMPLSSAMDGDALKARSARVLDKEVGYHRVNLSMMLAGASWAIFTGSMLIKRKSVRALAIAAGCAVILGQALTAGRMGYVTWGAIAAALTLLRWKRYVFVAPVLAVALLSVLPVGVTQRMLEGFGNESRDENSRVEGESTQAISLDGDGPDLYTVTAGRSFAWPFVIDKIWEAPVIGYGRLAMKRTGIFYLLFEQYHEGFPHPHNAYLELLLDSGLIGFALVIPFYIVVTIRAASLFRDRRSLIFPAIGGMTLALTGALLIAAFGSQTFYPREGSVGMWCAIGLMLRVGVQRRLALTEGVSGSKSPSLRSVAHARTSDHHRRGAVRAPKSPSLLPDPCALRSPAATIRTTTRRLERDKPVQSDIDCLLWRAV